jgi:hypothetical protein
MVSNVGSQRSTLVAQQACPVRSGSHRLLLFQILAAASASIITLSDYRQQAHYNMC